MTVNSVIVGVAIGALIGVTSGCASSQLSADDTAYGAGSGDLAVRGFLNAAAGRRYTEMAHLFGTSDGPAEKEFGVDEVEQRMVVLSQLLQHASFTLREPELRVLGPDHQWFVADMVGTRKGSVEVPIVAVQSKDDRWFVEQIDVVPLTRDLP
jgi:hypothetical protein